MSEEKIGEGGQSFTEEETPLSPRGGTRGQGWSLGFTHKVGDGVFRGYLPSWRSVPGKERRGGRRSRLRTGPLLESWVSLDWSFQTGGGGSFGDFRPPVGRGEGGGQSKRKTIFVVVGDPWTIRPPTCRSPVKDFPWKKVNIYSTVQTEGPYSSTSQPSRLGPLCLTVTPDPGSPTTHSLPIPVTSTTYSVPVFCPTPLYGSLRPLTP